MAHDKSPPPPTPTACEFCGKPHDVIFRGKVGGMKPRICGECVLGYVYEIAERAAAFDAATGSPAPTPAQSP